MKIDWCWACKKEHAMLDDDEFDTVWRTFKEFEKARYSSNKSLQTVAEKRDALANLPAQAQHQIGLTSRQLIFQPLQEAYEKVTGLNFEDDDPKLIMHYRMSFYGPPCPYCERLLRNANARQCFECGMDWHDPANVVKHNKL